MNGKNRTPVSRGTAPPPPLTPDEEKMPDTVRPSGTYTAFKDASNQIAFELALRKGTLVTRLREQAVKLAAEFDSWSTIPPTSEHRHQKIQELLSLRDQVNIYLDCER